MFTGESLQTREKKALKLIVGEFFSAKTRDVTLVGKNLISIICTRVRLSKGKISKLLRKLSMNSVLLSQTGKCFRLGADFAHMGFEEAYLCVESKIFGTRVQA